MFPFRSTGTVLVISGCFQTSSLMTSPGWIRYSSVADADTAGFSCAFKAAPREMAHVRSVAAIQTRRVFDSSTATFSFVLYGYIYSNSIVTGCFAVIHPGKILKLRSFVHPFRMGSGWQNEGVSDTQDDKVRSLEGPTDQGERVCGGGREMTVVVRVQLCWPCCLQCM